MNDVETILIGDKSRFAIESGILRAYENRPVTALGFFVIYLEGYCYGVREPDATMLGNSMDEVKKRISYRGEHIASFANEPDALKVAKAYRDVIYSRAYNGADVLGVSTQQFNEAIFSKNIQWAPDGDEAFDDGSYILQFDLENDVRLIAFRCDENGDPLKQSLRDLRITANEFYEILKNGIRLLKKT